MTETYTPPSTIAGVQRLAKKLRTQHGISYTAALDRAAGIANFENYRHALGKLVSTAIESGCSVPTYFTAYWIEPKTGGSGRETIKVLLPTPWAGILTRREFRYVRKIRLLRRVADDHLQFDEVIRSQDGARDALRMATRVFLFAAATGLRPATSSKALSVVYPDGAGRFPGEDHSTIWREGLCDHFVLVDEPDAMAIEDRSEARQQWVDRNRQHMIRSAWSGIHAPGSTALFLIASADRERELAAMEAGLAKLPLEQDDHTWTGESGLYRPLWRSPLQQAAADPVRARAPRNGLLPSRRRNNSIGYGGYLVARGSRRPDGQMPIEAHQEAGKLLKGVLAMAWRREGARGRVSSVRNCLDNWAEREYNHDQMSNEVFFDLYYNAGPRDFDREPTAVEKQHGIEQLARIAELLRKHYPNCAPLREVLAKLSYAERSLSTWNQPR